jgi:hypothetical protein
VGLGTSGVLWEVEPAKSGSGDMTTVLELPALVVQFVGFAIEDVVDVVVVELSMFRSAISTKVRDSTAAYCLVNRNRGSLVRRTAIRRNACSDVSILSDTPASGISKSVADVLDARLQTQGFVFRADTHDRDRHQCCKGE